MHISHIQSTSIHLKKQIHGQHLYFSNLDLLLIDTRVSHRFLIFSLRFIYKGVVYLMTSMAVAANLGEYRSTNHAWKLLFKRICHQESGHQFSPSIRLHIHAAGRHADLQEVVELMVCLVAMKT